MQACWRDLVLAGVHARHPCIPRHPATGVRLGDPMFLQARCCWCILDCMKLPSAFPAGAACEGGLPATGPGAGNPGHSWPAALHDKNWCSVSCREPGDFRRACGSGKEGACTAARRQLAELLFDALERWMTECNGRGKVRWGSPSFLQQCQTACIIVRMLA